MVTIESLEQLHLPLPRDIFFVDSAKFSYEQSVQALTNGKKNKRISTFTISKILNESEIAKLVGQIKFKTSQPFRYKACVIINNLSSGVLGLEKYDFSCPIIVLASARPAPLPPQNAKSQIQSTGRFWPIIKKNWKRLCIWIAAASALLLGVYGTTWKASLNEKDTIYNQMRAESASSPYGATYVQYVSPSLSKGDEKKRFVSSSSKYYNTISKNGNSLVNTFMAIDSRHFTVSPIAMTLKGTDFSLSPSAIATSSVGYISATTDPANRLYNYFDAVSLQRKFRVDRDWAENENNVCFISSSVADKLLAKLNEGQTSIKTYEDLLYKYGTRTSNDLRLVINNDEYVIANIIAKGDATADYYSCFESIIGSDFIYLSTSTSFYSKLNKFFTITATLPVSYYTLKNYLDENILSRWSEGDSISYYSIQKDTVEDITTYSWIQKSELNNLSSAFSRLALGTNQVDSFCYLGFFLICFVYFVLTILLMNPVLSSLLEANKNAYNKILYISILFLIPLGVSNGLMQLSRLSNTDFSMRLFFSGMGSVYGLLTWILPLIFFVALYFIRWAGKPSKIQNIQSIMGVKYDEFKI